MPGPQSKVPEEVQELFHHRLPGTSWESFLAVAFSYVSLLE